MNVTRSVTTNPDGKFNDTYTPPISSTWSVKASWNGNNVYTGSASLETQFTVTEPPSGGNIIITVKDSNGNPVEGASVSSTLTPGGKATLAGVTDSNGVIKFNELTPGTYTLQISKSGYVTETISVNVAAGETKQASATLQSPPAGIPGYPVITIVIAILTIITALQIKRKA